MLKKIIKKERLVIVLSLVLFFVLLSPYFLFAQERELEIEYPEIFGLKPKTIRTGLPEYAKYLFNFSITIVGLVLFAALIRGGLLYLTSAGNVVKLAEARSQISSAFLGVLLLLSGYLILTTINPQLAIFEFPVLKEAKLCEKDKDCPRGFECKEGKCLVKTHCNTDEDCPYTYECREGKCVKKTELATQIYWEIPVGQMLEEGLWEKERTNNLKALSITFEEFLKQEIKTGSPAFNRISDLNRYLKTLAEDCHCEELFGICQKPKNFAFPVGCLGDPCREVRDKINNVLKINEAKSKELSAYKEKIVETKKIFEDEGRKTRNLMGILESCKHKGLLTRAEYYDNLASLEEQGGKTILQRLYLPAENDPLVFYCLAGGTIFDEPYNPGEISLEELELAEEFGLAPAAPPEPLSCPGIIPAGELMDRISGISYEANSNLEELIYYIDKMSAGLTKMTELVSKCNESRCEVSCACIPNPCYEPACGVPPGRVNKCGVGKCTPPTPVTPNLCYFFCDSPCFQSLGGCHGEPCPRQEIKETVELIKIYEDEIFRLLTAIKGSIEDAQLVLKAKEKDVVDLRIMRADIQTCLSLGAQTVPPEKAGEEPFWMLLRCEMAIGNKGPDGNIITDCHPQNFYCCTSKPPALSPFLPTVQRERPATYTPLAKGPYSPSASPAYGFNKVPYFNQYDDRWRSKDFDCGTTIGNAGSGPTSMAMALNFFDVKTDPAIVADWVLENDYRLCRAEAAQEPGIAQEFCCQAVENFGKEKGLKCKEFHKDIKAVLNELKNGKNKVAVINSRAAPPYSKGGNYIVLTGIEKEWSQEFVYYNDPAYDHLRPIRRPAQGKKPIDWFENQNIGSGCVIYK